MPVTQGLHKAQHFTDCLVSWCSRKALQPVVVEFVIACGGAPQMRSNTMICVADAACPASSMSRIEQGINDQCHHAWVKAPVCIRSCQSSVATGSLLHASCFLMASHAVAPCVRTRGSSVELETFRHRDELCCLSACQKAVACLCATEHQVVEPSRACHVANLPQTQH